MGIQGLGNWDFWVRSAPRIRGIFGFREFRFRDLGVRGFRCLWILGLGIFRDVGLRDLRF